MLTRLPKWLRKILDPMEEERRALQQHRMRRAYKKMGDRYYLRDDEVCLSDECVAGIRNVDGDNREPEAQQ